MNEPFTKVGSGFDESFFSHFIRLRLFLQWCRLLAGERTMKPESSTGSSATRGDSTGAKWDFSALSWARTPWALNPKLRGRRSEASQSPISHVTRTDRIAAAARTTRRSSTRTLPRTLQLRASPISFVVRLALSCSLNYSSASFILS